MVTIHTTCFNIQGLHVLATWCSYLLAMILTIHSNYCVSLNCINRLASEKKTIHCVFLWGRTYLLYDIQMNLILRGQTQHKQISEDENQGTEKRQFCNQNKTTELHRHGIKSCFTGVCKFQVLSWDYIFLSGNWIELNWMVFGFEPFWTRCT